MPCYKSQEYKWRENLPTVECKGSAGEYCVFHAPKDKKGVSLEEFNKLVFEEMNKAKEQKVFRGLKRDSGRLIVINKEYTLLTPPIQL